MLPVYEPHHTPPISTALFVWRLLRHGLAAAALIAVSLVVGMLGYTVCEKMEPVDAFLNASMILGGMGPVKAENLSYAGKVFAGLYALYSGLLLIAIMGIMLAPVVHRVLHRFHWNDVDDHP